MCTYFMTYNKKHDKLTSLCFNCPCFNALFFIFTFFLHPITFPSSIYFGNVTEPTWPKCWRLSSWNLLILLLLLLFRNKLLIIYNVLLQKIFTRATSATEYHTSSVFVPNSSVNVILILNDSSVNKKWILYCILFTILSVFCSVLPM